jgi:hypothetical protein
MIVGRKFTKESLEEYYPKKERPDGKWKFINNTYFQELIPHYSDDLVYYKSKEVWVMKINGPSHFKWIGFEHGIPGRYRVCFDILFKNYVPEVANNIGFKTHFPSEKMYNLWLNETKLGEWKHVELSFSKIDSRKEPMILIFDGCVEPNEILLKNFKVYHL